MKIVLLGSGNVATHLGLALQEAGHEIIQIWSRNAGHAQELADLLNTKIAAAIEDVSLEGDLYILAVKDDAIGLTASRLSLTNQLIVHTSGSTGMNVLEGVSEEIGVIYPLQTFSRLKSLDLKKVPFIIEANTPKVASQLLDLARQISGHVLELNSEKREVLHVAAVFACNFTNYLYSLSGKILAEEEIDFDLLRPMIAETAAKVQYFSPDNVQTGPAVRRDEKTMEKHLEYLGKHPEWRELYAQLSQGIVNFHYKP